MNLYKLFLRPFLFMIDAETVSHLTIAMLPMVVFLMKWWRLAALVMALGLLFWLTPWWGPTLLIGAFIALLGLAYASRPDGWWRLEYEKARAVRHRQNPPRQPKKDRDNVQR